MPRSTASRSAYSFAHKLFAPRARQGAVPRDQLLARIFGSDAPRVVLIQGPAGHGKSTLLQQAMVECRARGMVAGWFTADDTDNDLRRLSLHLQALLAAMGEDPVRAIRSDDAKLSERGSRSDEFIARLLDFGQPVALFIDDFQALGNRSVLAFFRELLDHLPDNVRVFIGSRAIPDIGLARQVVNDRALVLRAEDLRFSLDEVRRFFACAQDLAMREDELAAIFRKTEGWPAAVQLFRLSLVSPSVRRSLSDLGADRPRELADYLADNVLGLQPREVQEFLRQTGPLTRLCGALCDDVLALLKRVLELHGGVVKPDLVLNHAQRLLVAAGADRGPGNALSDFQALEPLTDREKRILVLLANGVSNDEMASRMFVSRNTIKYHLKNIYAKLAVNGRLQAINAARSMGLIQ